MDIRESIVNDVLIRINGMVSEEVLNTIADTLILKLSKYEVTERCTDVAIRDESSEGMLRRFVATKRVEGLAESTIKRYVYENMKMISFLNKPLGEITTYDLRFYLSCKREQTKISNLSLDGTRRCMSSFFTWLNNEGLINRNPCASLAQIKSRKTVKKPFSQKDLEKIRRSCRNSRDRCLVEMLYCTGCRVSEISKMNISDINFETMECIVIGKGNKERYVYLSDVALLSLSEYLESRKDSSDALFIGKGSERIGKNGIETILRKIGLNAKVENVHPHRFRRTLATNLLDRGMSIQDVAQILGHADLKTTQIYCYISKTNVKNSYMKYVA